MLRQTIVRVYTKYLNSYAVNQNKLYTLQKYTTKQKQGGGGGGGPWHGRDQKYKILVGKSEEMRPLETVVD